LPWHSQGTPSTISIVFPLPCNLNNNNHNTQTAFSSSSNKIRKLANNHFISTCDHPQKDDITPQGDIVIEEGKGEGIADTAIPYFLPIGPSIYLNQSELPSHIFPAIMENRLDFCKVCFSGLTVYYYCLIIISLSIIISILL
jgi:hypothetical protein